MRKEIKKIFYDVEVKRKVNPGDRLRLLKPMFPLYVRMKGRVRILKDSSGTFWSIRCVGKKRDGIWEVIRNEEEL